MSTDAADADWLRQAIDLAARNVGEGGGPFGAILVKDGQVVAEGVNRVTADLDPTAHAEVVAIRAACRTIGDFSLEGATLYASCEPCPLCLSAALWARLDAVVHAADRHAHSLPQSSIRQCSTILFATSGTVACHIWKSSLSNTDAHAVPNAAKTRDL